MSFSLVSIGLGTAFELATHVFLHYTVEGGEFGAGLGESLSPLMAGLGLTYSFSQKARDTAVAGLEADDPLMSVPGIGPTQSSFGGFGSAFPEATDAMAANANFAPALELLAA